jgi:hypothetical protein
LQGGYLAVADHIQIGELEFADCVVTVTDRASVTDEDGLIGANVFGAYLIDIDFPAEKLRLSPLPRRPDETVAPTALNSEGESYSNPDDDAEGPSDQKAEPTGDASKTDNVAPEPLLPKDRYIAPEMKSWSPIFRFGHQLLIRTEVNDSKPMLFLIDTGTTTNLLSIRAGRQITKVRSDPNRARISACRAARVRKLEATRAQRATKRELIVVATMISRTIGTSAFSDRTEFSVTTATGKAPRAGCRW